MPLAESLGDLAKRTVGVFSLGDHQQGRPRTRLKLRQVWLLTPSPVLFISNCLGREGPGTSRRGLKVQMTDAMLDTKEKFLNQTNAMGRPQGQSCSTGVMSSGDKGECHQGRSHTAPPGLLPGAQGRANGHF